MHSVKAATYLPLLKQSTHLKESKAAKSTLFSSGSEKGSCSNSHSLFPSDVAAIAIVEASFDDGKVKRRRSLNAFLRTPRRQTSAPTLRLLKTSVSAALWTRNMSYVPFREVATIQLLFLLDIREKDSYAPAKHYNPSCTRSAA